MSEKVDAVVVGAGPSGTTASLMMAKAGLSVVLVERGDRPGSKNIAGGIIHKWALKDAIPNFWEEAPLEREIKKHRYTIFNKDDNITTEYTDTESSFSLLRSKFDPWLVSKAEEEGVMLITSILITDLIRDNGKIVGVMSGSRDEDILMADVTIAADGANSIISEKSGLRPKIDKTSVIQSVKEVITMPPHTLENRFNIEKGEGVAWRFVGDIAEGIYGDGFIYTNRETLSIGVSSSLENLIKNEITPDKLLDKFISKPEIACLIENGKVREYSAHLIPKYPIPNGNDSIISMDGFISIGDASPFTSYIFREGISLAIKSGISAAQTVIEAKENGIYNSISLGKYKEYLYTGNEVRTHTNIEENAVKILHSIHNRDVKSLVINLDDKLFNDKFNIYKESHIKVSDQSKCEECNHKNCVTVCPAGVFEWTGERLIVSYEGCLECGSCRLVCDSDCLDWNYPVGGHGISYKYG